MEHIVRCATSFDASHRIEHDPWCGRGDGHHYRVEVSASATVNAQNLLSINPQAFQDDVEALGHMLNGNNLNEMLPASRTYLEDIAAWFMESLLGRYKNLLQVRVWQNEATSVIVTRQER